jgi:hypothetical protein
MKNRFVLVLMILGVLAPLVFSGCASQPTSEGFAIYLTKDDVPVAQMAALSHVDLAAAPVISVDDIVWYLPGTHEIELTPEAYQRINALQIPTSGISFVVCVDKEPIYWGAFWTPISSQSFDGIVINIPPFNVSTQPENLIKISLGYPAPSFFQGVDPRSNPVIYNSLEQAGKMVSA